MPLITPGIFGRYVVPANRRIICMIRGEFSTPPAGRLYLSTRDGKILCFGR